VFTEPLRRELGAGPTALTTVFSVGLAAFMTGVLVGGRVADSIAPRRMALGAAVGTVAGLLGSAAASSGVVLVLSFGVVLGGTTGLGYATAVRVAGTMRSGRGVALGLVVSAYAIGTAVLAPVAATLLLVVGRSWTFVLLALVLGAIVLTAAVLLPDEAAATAPAAETPTTDRQTPRGPVMALWLAFGLGSAPALAAFAHAGQLAGATASAAVAVTLLNIGNFVGRLIAGPASDRMGRRATLHANSALLVVACVPLALGVDGPLALVTLFLLGTQYGALSTLTPSFVSAAVPCPRLGSIFGRVFTGRWFSGVLAPVAASALAVVTGFGIAYAGFIVVAAVSWTCVALYARSARVAAGPALSD
jgi:MFS family permease